MSAKIATSSSITWLMGWMRPRVSGPSGSGNVTSARSAARRVVSAASPISALRAAIASWTRSRRPLSTGPFSFRCSAVMPPSVFRSSETVPFLPSVAILSCSNAASSAAPATRVRIVASSSRISLINSLGLRLSAPAFESSSFTRLSGHGEARWLRRPAAPSARSRSVWAVLEHHAQAQRAERRCGSLASHRAPRPRKAGSRRSLPLTRRWPPSPSRRSP